MRALLEQMDGDLVALYRVVSAREIVFARRARPARCRASRAQSSTWSATTGPRRDATSSRRRRLAELVPDICERDVYVCGPPGMVDRIVPDLRAAGVPRRQLHVERFAL